MIRQGDVLLVPVEGVEAPEGVEAKTLVILAEGEVTGHAHRLRGSQVLDWEVDGQRYVRVVNEIGTLHHEDHDPTPVPVVPADTTYRVIQQREWNLEGQWRQVVD